MKIQTIKDSNYILDFGEYKGQKIKNIPLGYLTSLLIRFDWACILGAK